MKKILRQYLIDDLANIVFEYSKLIYIYDENKRGNFNKIINENIPYVSAYFPISRKIKENNKYSENFFINENKLLFMNKNYEINFINIKNKRVYTNQKKIIIINITNTDTIHIQFLDHNTNIHKDINIKTIPSIVTIFNDNIYMFFLDSFYVFDFDLNIKTFITFNKGYYDYYVNEFYDIIIKNNDSIAEIKHDSKETIFWKF